MESMDHFVRLIADFACALRSIEFPNRLLVTADPFSELAVGSLAF